MKNRWYDYVVRVAGTDNQSAIARNTGITQGTLSKWKLGNSTPTPAQVAKFAQGYGVPVLEAFVEAQFLTPEEAGQAPTRPRIELFSSEELMAELTVRLDPAYDDGRPWATPDAHSTLEQLHNDRFDLVHDDEVPFDEDSHLLAARDTDSVSDGLRDRERQDLDAEQPDVCGDPEQGV